MRALLIRSPYVEKILDGKKTWEIRGSRTSVRGPIAFVRSGSSTVVGVCNVVDCVGPLTAEEFRQNARKAGLKPNEAALGYYKKTYAWVVAKPRWLKAPVPYVHPNGAVIWVKLDEGTERVVLRALKR
jgi:hypothetical protein